MHFDVILTLIFLTAVASIALPYSIWYPAGMEIRNVMHKAGMVSKVIPGRLTKRSVGGNQVIGLH